MPEIFGEDTYQQDPVEVLTNVEVTEADPLKLDLKDEDIVEVIDSMIKDSRRFFKRKKLYERRKKNEDYYLGKQTERLEEEHKLKKYNARYQDNVIFEAEGTLKAVAISRVPDLLIKPGNDTEESRKIAEELTDVINSRMRKRENRTVLGRAYSHRPIYFTGVVKPRWDSEKGKHGDYVFENVHPNNIDIDHTASCNDADEMDWIAHHYELSIKEILMRWPKKRKELFEELKWDDKPGSEEKKLASKLKISEVWFTWYKKEEEEWSRVEGTVWKYKKVVFDKIKNPYWDWEGETIMFTFDPETKGKIPVSEMDLRQSLFTGMPLQGLGTERIYHNHFENPRKPFIFMGHKQMGMQAYDETTRIEQASWLQDNINVRGKQITEMANKASGKDVYSTDSGLAASDVEAIDRENPNQDLLVDGKLGDVFMHIPGILPTAALFQEQNINRERLFSKEGTNAALRGVREGPDPATKTQLFKESDYTRIDEEVEDTINTAAEHMADWAMQFMKLFYTEEHMERLMGQNGAVVFQSIDRDMIEDGMEVEVSASSVDKLRRKREAFDLAGQAMIDPIQFFRDIEASDPEGRAEALMLYQTQPMLYFQRYIEGNETTPDMAAALGAAPVGGPPPSPEAQAIGMATAPPPGEVV